MNELLKRITTDPAIMTGAPCVRGLRVTVSTVLGLLSSGAAREEILKSYPHLEPADIDACLAYAAWKTREYDLPLTPVNA